MSLTTIPQPATGVWPQTTITQLITVCVSMYGCVFHSGCSSLKPPHTSGSCTDLKHVYESSILDLRRFKVILPKTLLRILACSSARCRCLCETLRAWLLVYLSFSTGSRVAIVQRRWLALQRGLRFEPGIRLNRKIERFVESSGYQLS